MKTTLCVKEKRLSLIPPDGFTVSFGDRRLDEKEVETLRGISERYWSAMDDADALVQIGRDLYRWADGGSDWLKTICDRLPSFELEIHYDAVRPDADVLTFLNAPWEILADDKGFLAAQENFTYAPVRRLGEASLSPPPPDGYRLGVVFMAGAPTDDNVSEIDYEQEEAAFIAAANEGVDLAFDDSGDPENLAERLEVKGDAQRPPWPVIHLSSCGRDILMRATPNAPLESSLILEDEFGSSKEVGASDLIDVLKRARLAFLSTFSITPPDEAQTSKVDGYSIASALVRGGMAAALSWRRSAVDDDMGEIFAKAFYKSLNLRHTPTQAAAQARRAVLHAERKQAAETARVVEPHRWHRARLWLDRDGGEPIVGGREPRSLAPADHTHKRIQDGKANSRVAGPEFFVGRRREMQDCLRKLKSSNHAGLLLHGVGQTGKTSLAERIANRMKFDLAFVSENYDAVNVLEALLYVLDDDVDARNILKKAIDAVAKEPERFGDAMSALLNGPCKQRRPVLLLIDDLDVMLKFGLGAGRDEVKDIKIQEVFKILLTSFNPSKTLSRLIITSQRPFKIMDSGKDLIVKKLYLCHISTLSKNSSDKLALRNIKSLRKKFNEDKHALCLEINETAQTISCGHPGLHHELSVNLALACESNLANARMVLEEARAWWEKGVMPSNPILRDYLNRVGFEALLNEIGEEERRLLKAATVFEAPVPKSTLERLSSLARGSPYRLIDFGLFDPYKRINREALTIDYLVHPLLRKRITPLSDRKNQKYAAWVAPSLNESWRSLKKEPRPSDRVLVPMGRDVLRLGLFAKDAEIVHDVADFVVGRLFNAKNWSDVADLGERTIHLLAENKRTVASELVDFTVLAFKHSNKEDEARKLSERFTQKPSSLVRFDKPLKKRGSDRFPPPLDTGGLDLGVSAFSRMDFVATNITDAAAGPDAAVKREASARDPGVIVRIRRFFRRRNRSS